MTEFVIYLHGNQGTLLVDGEEPALFGELVGCEVRRMLPKPLMPDASRFDRILACERPIVEVTLRLPLGSADHATLVRDNAIQDVDGPTGDTLTTEERLKAIGRIHRSNELLGTAEFGIHCVHCRFAWPCPTRRALDGDPHAVDGNTAP